jgi:hypothetical protein
MKSALRTLVPVAALLAGLAARARADSGPVEPAPAPAPAAAPAEAPLCTGPAADRPPDPRCGETLDGRVPAGPSPELAVPRAALAVPRLATQAVFWPVVETTELVEQYQLLGWMNALLTTDDGLIGVRPIVNYSTSFLPSGGARFFYKRLPGPGSEIAAQFQTAGPQVMMGRLDLLGPSRYGLALAAMWDRRDDRLFAGLGPNSMAALTAAGLGLARYSSDNFLGELRWSRRLPLHLVAYGHGDLRWRDYGGSTLQDDPSVYDLYGLPAASCAALGLAAPCVDPLQMPGFAHGLRILHAGASLGLGLRDPGREGRGASLVLDGTYAEGFAGDPSRHATFTAEGVVAVGAVNRTFLVRGRAAMVEPFTDAPVPFEELVSPAGLVGGMRGFPDGRFRGQSGLVGTAEYRWYISSFLDASLFSDVGTVAGRRFSGLGWDNWFPDFGVGLRFFKTVGPYWEAIPRSGIQVAYAPDGGVRVLLSMAGF